MIKKKTQKLFEFEVEKPLLELSNGQFRCTFCKLPKELKERTEMYYKGKWYSGCSKCFMDMLHNLDKFKNTQFNLD